MHGTEDVENNMEHQLSFFDEEPLSWFSENLMRGSGFAGGKVRIYAAALNMDKKKFAEYLKNEYGVGGCSIKDGFMDYGPTGIKLRKWKENYEEMHGWNEASEEIKRLISIDLYLTKKEKEQIKEIQVQFKKIPIPVPRTHYPFVLDN